MPKHFGESANFLLIDSDTGETSRHPANDLPCRGPCRCHRPASENRVFDAVICRAIGHRELLELKKKGISVFQTTEASPHSAMQQWRENKLHLAERSICFKGRRKPAQPAMESAHRTTSNDTAASQRIES
ncbi:MAG: NifB/NifX family molybdenum-iron cluster-binding protein [Formivibrio sp.]|nr:NifB/NifX family molybdenum-iron cluster-binding protein [Formivibrio sp.]